MVVGGPQGSRHIPPAAPRLQNMQNARDDPPVVLYHRAGDASRYIELVKKMIRHMYAENPDWLAANNVRPAIPKDQVPQVV